MTPGLSFFFEKYLSLQLLLNPLGVFGETWQEE
jgi:hypothetical protein